MIELPDIPHIPERATGHELTNLEARLLIEVVSQREWGIDWHGFRWRWNHSEREGGFNDDEREQLRPLARILPHAARGSRRGGW